MREINPNGADTLLEEILAVNDFTDVRQVQSIKDRLQWRNTADRKNDPIFQAAREKLGY